MDLHPSKVTGGNKTLSMMGYGYGAILCTGGLMGFIKKGSNASLTAGLILGGMSLYGAHQLSTDRHNYIILASCSGLTSAAMGYRLFQSRKIMPAGVATGLSLAMFGYLAYSVRLDKLADK